MERVKTMNNNEIHDQVVDFIQSFNKFGVQVEQCFSNGRCYWFAAILKQRFPYNARILYDTLYGHFACEIDGWIYDITGDISDMEVNWQDWETLKVYDPYLALRLVRDCIL